MSPKRQKPIRVAIVGSRQFRGTAAAARFLDRCLSQFEPDRIEIVSGGAPGADRYGERYAQARKLPVRQFAADWQRNGKRAGTLRNDEMVAYATHVIALWDGKSLGTAQMIRLATQRGRRVRVWNTRVQKHDRTYFN